MSFGNEQARGVAHFKGIGMNGYCAGLEEVASVVDCVVEDFTGIPNALSMASPYRFPNSLEPAESKCMWSELHVHAAEETT